MAIDIATARTEIAKLYIASFNRVPDSAGLDFWVDSYVNKGQTLDQIANNFTNSTEYTTKYPAFQTTAEYVEAVYVNVFGRASDAAGKAYWVARLDNAATAADHLTHGTLMNALVAAAAANGSTDGAKLANQATFAVNAVLTNLDNASATAQLVNITSDAATITTATAATTGAVDATFTLTTGVDAGAAFTSTANNDIFNALSDAGADTFTSLDSINGAAGTDTLNILETAAIDTTASLGNTVAGIEVANLTSAVSVTANTTTWTGLETLNITSVGATIATAAATTNVNELTSIDASTINGGKDVTIVHTTAGNVTATATAGTLDITSAKGNVIVGGGAAATNALGAVNVDMTATATANAGTIEMDGATTFAVTATGAVSLADRTAHAAASTAANVISNNVGGAGTAFDADGAAGTLATALATLAGKYTAANAASDTEAESKALTLTELNAGRITLANKVAIDNAYNVAINAVGGTATLAQAAALAVITPIKAAADAAKVVTAAALVTATAATVAVAAEAVVAADTAVAGAVDNMIVTAIQNSALTSATITGNYGAANSAITDASALNNTLTTVTLNNAGVEKKGVKKRCQALFCFTLT